MDLLDKSEESNGTTTHTLFVPTPGYYTGRKVVAVETNDGIVKVVYDQEGYLERKVYQNYDEFIQQCNEK